MTPERKLEQVEVLIEALIKVSDEDNESYRLLNYDILVILKLIRTILESAQSELAAKNQFMFADSLQFNSRDA